MSRNNIARKLSLYFGASLLAFALVVGVVFVMLFRNHTLKLHETELARRAESIASSLSGYMETGRGGMMGGYGMYLRFIGDIAGTDVWIVDSNLNLVTSGMGRGQMSGDYVYSDLPPNADSLIREVFDDKIVYSDEFSGLLSEATLTVGVPVKSNGSILGVVLLHSPVHGINDATLQGVLALVISIVAAFSISLLLSLWLAKSFTDPIVSKEAQDALRLDKIRRDFVTNISHELRTPVTVIRGSLEAIVEKVVSEPAQVDEYHQQMLNEAVYLQGLVGDLLDLSKLQNADFVIEKSEISVCDCLNDAMRSVSQMAAAKNIVLLRHGEPKSCKILGDYGRLRQMLIIVLDNAVKFAPNNGKVDVTWTDNSLTVHDNGFGISEEDLPNIFERFYKSRSEQNKTGTGLGLAIAKQIAERHGIELTAASDDGASFIFKF